MNKGREGLERLLPFIFMNIIRASEVGEYVYCARAWWLRRVGGLRPQGGTRFELGTALHARHGRAVALSRTLVIAGVVLALVAAALLLAAQ